jgi:hypothetical protein
MAFIFLEEDDEGSWRTHCGGAEPRLRQCAVLAGGRRQIKSRRT